MIGGHNPNTVCDLCQAGGLYSFAWNFRGPPGWTALPATAFIPTDRLRFGTLYRCSKCRHPWHLDAFASHMSIVAIERVPLILEWNAHPIRLPEELTGRLKLIEPSPPDYDYGGRPYDDTPCSVITRSGERFDVAFVSRQASAPYEDFRDYRLGSDIQDIEPSPYALALDVRMATAEVMEVAMGAAPVHLQAPDGREFVVNGKTSFFRVEGYRAGEIRLSSRRGDRESLREAPLPSPPAVHFIVDP